MIIVNTQYGLLLKLFLTFALFSFLTKHIYSCLISSWRGTNF